jgi:hypothetical protein
VTRLRNCREQDGIEDGEGNMIIDQKQVLNVWEIYVEELYVLSNRPENLNVEPEEVDEDHKGPRILRSDVKKAMKEMRDKKATEMTIYLWKLSSCWEMMVSTYRHS